MSEPKEYNGVIYESEEELMTLLWLEELQQEGYVDRIEKAQSFNLSDGLSVSYTEVKELKTKSKEVQKRQIILEGHIYTPEFRVLWKPKSVYNKFLWKYYRDINERFNSLFMYEQTPEGPVTYIEVKPGWDQNNMTRLFKINQKWVYEKYGIYVNLIQPHKLFENTWTPEKWLTTKTGKKRAINWDVRTLQEYLERLSQENKER